jgi:hypothetical protein
VVRNPLFWPAVLTAAIVPLGFVFLRLRSATWLARSTLLYSWPVLIFVLLQAARGTLLRYPGSAYADGTLAVPFEPQPAHARVVWIIFDEPLAWSSAPNVFDAARNLGFNTALVGWFHPYGRLLTPQLIMGILSGQLTDPGALPGLIERYAPDR